MLIKAKFICWSVVEPNEGETDRKVNLFPVTTGSVENQSFAKNTPTGQLTLQISPETQAFDYFTVGKEYYLTIEECDESKK